MCKIAITKICIYYLTDNKEVEVIVNISVRIIYIFVSLDL